MNPLEQACSDILYKNMNHSNERVYLLYDTLSPLARMLSDAYASILPDDAVAREFKNPPSPLYRGWLINPENPHVTGEIRIVSEFNVEKNIELGLNHHTVLEWIETESQVEDQIESIKNELINLPKWSIVILVQSTNFRLSTFRIRLELFHRGIHVVEHNHLAYMPEGQFETVIDTLQYHTPEYISLHEVIRSLSENTTSTRIISVDNSILTFGPTEGIRGNTWDYSGVENKWGTFPIGELFTEAIDLESVHGECLIDTYPQEDFSIVVCEPFRLVIEKGRVLPSPDFPPSFQRLYDLVVQYEGEVMVRELGFGLNPGVSTEKPLRDINYHERKVGIHLSLGKKHGIFGKKLPKDMMQRFHIDVFVALQDVRLGEASIFEKGRWTC